MESSEKVSTSSTSQKLDIDGIVASLKSIKKLKHVESTKQLIRLLVRLSHCASLCRKLPKDYGSITSKGNELFTATKIICENLLEIPDKERYFAAIYHILLFFLDGLFFNEAQVITTYLLPGFLIKENDGFELDNYWKISILWYSALLKKLDLLTKNDNIKKDSIDKEFCDLVHFNMTVVKYSQSDQYFFKTVEAFIKKLVAYPLAVIYPCLFQLLKDVSNYIRNLSAFAISEAYALLIPMLGLIFFKRKDCKNNPDILKYFRECDVLLLECLKRDRTSYNCYKLFREYSLNLFESNFMLNEFGEARFNKVFCILNDLKEKYEDNDFSLKETVAALAYGFEIVFPYLENVVSKKFIGSKINKKNIISVGKLVKSLYSLHKKRTISLNFCQKCPKDKQCVVKSDIYSASSLVYLYLRVLTRFSSEILDDEIFDIYKDIMTELISALKELEEADCLSAPLIWDSCAKSIFNFGLMSETKYSAQLQSFYEFLCQQIIKRDGLNAKNSSFGLEDPVGCSLHRLANANFIQDNFKESMNYTAYNALLSNTEDRKKKAFIMWASCKMKLLNNKEIQELSIVQCIKEDEKIAKKLGISINLSRYDLSDLCLRELKALFSAKDNCFLSMKKTLSEIESMDAPLHYAQGVLLLCFHAMQFSKREFILDYINKAIKKITKLNTPVAQCTLANLSFFLIIERFYARSQAIAQQMENADFTIKAFQKLKGLRVDNLLDDEVVTVPTYGDITIQGDNKNVWYLNNKCFAIWEKCIEKHLTTIINDWEPKFTLETIIICGEYCRLYKFNILEKSIWKIAYKLALSLNDITTCTYITSRSLSLRHINDQWICEAEKYAESTQCSNKPAEIDVVILFWLSLADFYCDCKRFAEAKNLLEKIKTMPLYDLIGNSKLYIYGSEIRLRNFYQLYAGTGQKEYCDLLVEIHYLMITLNDVLGQETCRFWNIRFQLLAVEHVFEALRTVAIPMNSLLSYREISAHLSNGLKFAQKLGLTLKIAQINKYLCHIDLLRLQVDQCEARLQDLEHILCIENFELSMKSKLSKEANTQLNSMLREWDSPDLKKKLFSSPDFITHSSGCDCLNCSNLHYQYVVFSCVHQRAQLYSLLNQVAEAENQFNGASLIKSRLNERDVESIRQYKNYKWKTKAEYIIDQMLFLLDYSMYLVDFKKDCKEDALMLIEEVLDIAKEHDLINSCVYFYAMELYFQHHVYDILDSKIAISVPEDIPITLTNQPVDNCFTPKGQHTNEKLVIQRGRKSPVLVAIPKISIENTVGKENNCGNSPKPKNMPTTSESKVPVVKRVSVRNVRRKILIDEADENSTKAELDKHIRKSKRLSSKKNNDPVQR